MYLLDKKAGKMYAHEITSAHIGQDLTLTIGGVTTGGIIHGISRVFGMVSVDIEGTFFTMDVEKVVVINRVPAMQQ